MAQALVDFTREMEKTYCFSVTSRDSPHSIPQDKLAGATKPYDITSTP